MQRSPDPGSETDSEVAPRVLYCHCRYAKVIDEGVKREVLAGLSASALGFEAVADLCEMSARKDSSLARLAAPGPVKIAACFPRAVKWLFHAAGTPLDPAEVEVLNMREAPAADVVAGLLRPEVRPNLDPADGASADGETPGGDSEVNPEGGADPGSSTSMEEIA